MELRVLGRRLVVHVDDGDVLQWIAEYWDFPATAAPSTPSSPSR